MARVLATSAQIPEPKSQMAVEKYTPQSTYPSHLYREQFWWRSDGAAVVPAIDHLSPDSAPALGSDMRLFVHGTGFMSNSVIVFNDVEEPTTMESSGILSTGVRPSLFLVPAVVTVQVKTGDEVSNTLNFTFY